MKAIRISETGDLDFLKYEDIPKPSPGNGEVCVRIHFAGVNFIDTYIRSGYYKRQLPLTLGMEASGVVEAVGPEVQGLAAGDRVAYAGHPGSYAQYSVLKAEYLIPLPADINFEQGAAFPLQGMTAHYLTHDLHHVMPGEVVLVHAAAGGVGLILVQWLKHLGARVIGTVSTSEKAQAAHEAGADGIINYTAEDFVQRIMQLTNGRGADYIIDGVGRATFAGDLEAVRVRGHVCLFGSSSGACDPVAVNSLMPRSVTVSGATLWNFIATREDLIKRAEAVIGGIREGWLKVHIDSIFDLKDAASAHRVLQARKTIGKVLLRP
ncbi:MAG: quinone oxidoreductase [Candidatus Omnitrophica bacterium]|nr:quinone oxidoreductase [Candidatus Omnitrophota bacterium]